MLQKNKAFQVLFKHAPLGVLVIDQAGRIVLINPNAEKLFGYKKEELIGREVECLIPKHLQQNHQDHRTHYFEKPRVRSMGAGLDLQARHKDNTEFPVEISLGHYQFSGEKFAVAFISDIRKRSQFEDALNEQNRKHQTLINNLPGMVYRGKNDENWTMEYCSERCLQITGYSSEEMVNGTVTFGKNLILPEDREFVIDTIQKALKDKEPFELEYRILSRNGDIKWILEEGEGIFDKNGVLLALEGYITERTDRKRAEEELQSSKEKFKALFEQAGGYCMILDPNTKTGIPIIVDVNHAACDMHGYSREELVGKPIGIIDDEEANKLIKERTALIMTGKPFQVENIHVRKDGTTFPVRVHAKRIDVEGEPPLIFTTEYDITKQKEAEEGLIKAKDQLLALNLSLEEKVKTRTKELTDSLEREKEMSEMKSRFVSMASHEFRTPLSSVLSSVSLIDRYRQLQDFDKQEKHIERIKSSVQNLTDILTDFLSVDKLEQGKIEAKSVEFNLCEFIKETVLEMNGIKKKGQEIHFRYDGTEEAFLDKNIVRNIMLNLLSNAIKYSEKDINVVARRKGNHVTIDVEDKGIGIPKAEQKNMFSNFFRANNAANIQGTGLGLKIVEQYVELLDGTIEFESEEGKGTTFKVQLPIKND